MDALTVSVIVVVGSYLIMIVCCSVALCRFALLLNQYDNDNA